MLWTPALTEYAAHALLWREKGDRRTWSFVGVCITLSASPSTPRLLFSPHPMSPFYPPQHFLFYFHFIYTCMILSIWTKIWKSQWENTQDICLSESGLTHLIEVFLLASAFLQRTQTSILNAYCQSLDTFSNGMWTYEVKVLCELVPFFQFQNSPRTKPNSP